MINMVKLSEVSDLTVGYVGPMGKEYVENGTLFLRSLNIKPFSFDLTDVKYITEDFNETISKSILHYNDVVIVRTGIPGIAAVVPKEFDGCNCSDLVIVHPDTSKINPYYLCAFINSWGRLQVKNAKVGAIQKHFNVTEAKEMLIPLPDMEEQNLIANILRDINGKINLNNKIHSKLDSLLHSIYDYWFLQFEFPNEEGKPYKSSGGKMVWNEELKREIPEGWEVFMVKDFCDIFTGKKDVNQALDTGKYKFFSCAPGYKYSNDKLYTGKAILISGNGSYTGRTIFVNDSFDLYQRTYACVMKPNYDNMLEYIFYTMKTFFVKRVSGGTHGSAIPYIVYNDIANEHFYYNKEVVDTFMKTIESIQEHIIELSKESQELASLRDFLLPLLMNGQVTFKEVE